MKLLAATIASLALIASASVVAQELDIKRNGSRPSSKGSAETFTGAVRVDPLFAAQDTSRTSGGAVTVQVRGREGAVEVFAFGLSRRLANQHLALPHPGQQKDRHQARIAIGPAAPIAVMRGRRAGRTSNGARRRGTIRWLDFRTYWRM